MDLPILHPLIQPIWVNKTYDESTNVSNYHMRFRGPSDTREELGLISLVEGKFFIYYVLNQIKLCKSHQQFINKDI